MSDDRPQQPLTSILLPASDIIHRTKLTPIKHYKCKAKVLLSLKTSCFSVYPVTKTDQSEPSNANILRTYANSTNSFRVVTLTSYKLTLIMH